MPAFMALAANRPRARRECRPGKSMPTMRIPSTSASLSTLSAPTPAEQDVGAFCDLVGQPVIEIVMHLGRQFIVTQIRENDLFFVIWVGTVVRRRSIEGHCEFVRSTSKPVRGENLASTFPTCGRLPYHGKVFVRKAISSGRQPVAGVQSVERAFSVLSRLSERPTALSELARAVDLPVSTTSRLLGTLEALGAVERLDPLGVYRIGPAILSMASAADQSQSLVAIAEDEMIALSEELGEAVGLSVPAGHNMHYTSQVMADSPIQVRDWVGEQIPMHLVSSGLVLLANWTSDAVENYADRDLEGPTKNSITDADQLRDRVEAIRDAGVAWTHEELESGINSVAAPLFVAGEAVAAIHLHGPAFRFPGDRTEQVEKAVMAAAERINLMLGPLGGW